MSADPAARRKLAQRKEQLAAARIVGGLDITELAEAIAGTGTFAFIVDDHGVRFVCPRCRYLDHNGGTAEVLDAWRWSCWRCRGSWTRHRLEWLVLGNADAFDRAIEIGVDHAC